MARISFRPGLALADLHGLKDVTPAHVHCELWRRLFSVGVDGAVIPEAVWRLLSFELPSPGALRMELRQDGFKYIQLCADEMRVSPLVVGVRSVRGNSVHHLLVQKHRNAESGLGIKMLRNAVVLYRLLGLGSIQLTAGLDRGGALWSRLGFKPVDAEEWARVQDHLRMRLQRLEMLPWPSQNHAARAQFQMARLVLKTNRPEAIWVLNGLDEPLPDQAAQATFVRRIGPELLAGSRWRGIFQLDDPLTLAQMDAHIERRNQDPRRRMMTRSDLESKVQQAMRMSDAWEYVFP